PLVPDPRWIFHTFAANTYEPTIPPRRRRRGDAEGAADARRQAGKEFRLAAASPGAPIYIRDAASGYAKVFEGGADIENSRLAVLVLLRELRGQAESRGDTDVQKGLEEKIRDEEKYIMDLRLTQGIETLLSQAGKKYLEAGGMPPESAGDLLQAGFIPGLPRTPLDDDEGADAWIALPDGSFKSRKLADLETENHLDVFLSACIDYRRDNAAAPPVMGSLVEKGYLKEIPEPPLRLLGQHYELNESGIVVSLMPEGPEPPPELREGG
ncbi:MAG: hypothetical protein LBV15_04290, partial [Planctomycetota bacterium]|nr:hypothetical protein [Planctomycetota bacterium]